jgi:hypothetical protein
VVRKKSIASFLFASRSATLVERPAIGFAWAGGVLSCAVVLAESGSIRTIAAIEFDVILGFISNSADLCSILYIVYINGQVGFCRGSRRNRGEARKSFGNPAFTGPIRMFGAGRSLVVPMEELMRDLPLTIAIEQSENVGSSGIGTSQLA